MIADKQDILRLHEIQMELFNEFLLLCQRFNLKYFLIHGSLLGTVVCNGFMPFDDDIDIAMPRNDFEKFISEGKEFLPPHIFVQSCSSDPKYPLVFAKIRNSKTTYIVKSLRKVHMNHGIYLDVFPIDYSQKIDGHRSIKYIMLKVYETRIGSVFSNKSYTFPRVMKRILAFLICPSWKVAIRTREKLLKSIHSSDFIQITGGKITDQNIPFEWFNQATIGTFEGRSVSIPIMWDKYLKHIYGDYRTYSPAQKDMVDENHVVLNAEVLDFETSFEQYFKKNFDSKKKI